MDQLNADLQAGIAASRAGDTERASAYFTRVIEQDAGNASAWLGLSKLLPTAEQSLRCVEHVLYLHPNHPLAREEKAMLQMRLLVEESAVVASEAPIPSTPERRYLLGETLVAVGVLSMAQLHLALKEQARLEQEQQSERLGEILLRLRLIQPEQLEAALAGQIATLSTSIASRGPLLIGEFLVRHNFITREQLTQTLDQQAELKRQGESVLLGELLVLRGFLERSQLNHALLAWQHWYQRSTEIRDDPYAPIELPALTTRGSGFNRVWRSWAKRLRPRTM